jgi:hypothetical protein
MAEKLNNFDKFDRIFFSKFTHCLTQWPSNYWPGVLDHLDISLVDGWYKRRGIMSENLLLTFSQGLAYKNIPQC